MSRIISDKIVYVIEIPSNGLWYHWHPMDYWSFENLSSKDEFYSYDEAVSAAKKENIVNYRIIRIQTVESVVDVRFRKNYERESGSAIEGLKYE